MTEKELAELTDEELLQKAKKNEINFHNKCRTGWISDRNNILQHFKKQFRIFYTNPFIYSIQID